MDLALSSFCCLLKLTVTSKLGVSLVLNELYNLPNIKKMCFIKQPNNNINTGCSCQSTHHEICDVHTGKKKP